MLRFSVAVVPALGGGGADAVQARERGDLAEPSTHIDILEVAGVPRGQDLGHGSRVQFMLQPSHAIGAGFEGVVLELIVVVELVKTAGRPPFVGYGQVAARRCGCRRCAGSIYGQAARRRSYRRGRRNEHGAFGGKVSDAAGFGTRVVPMLARDPSCLACSERGRDGQRQKEGDARETHGHRCREQGQ